MTEIDLPKLGNGWSQYQELVMDTLERHGKSLDMLDNKLNDLRVDIASFKGKAAAWCAVAGMAVGGFVAIVVDVVTRTITK